MTDDGKTKSVHLIVEGRVQAVGFRYFTWQTAQSFDVTGWVRNREDGSVEIAAEGSADHVNHFVQAIKKGSPFSRVKHVDMHEYDHEQHYASFDILNSI